MIRSILFPTDFSEVANSAFPLATALAEACRAGIIALHISSSATRGSTDPQHDFPDPINPAVRLERSIISKSKTEDYADAIMRKAVRRKCDLIVMASHGRSDMAQFFLGRSVAERVARESPTPAIVLRLSRRHVQASNRIARIIYLTDLTQHSRAVLPTVLAIAHGMNARIDVLSILTEGKTQLADNSGGRRSAERFLAEAGGGRDFLGDFANVPSPAAVIERATGDVDLIAFTATLGFISGTGGEMKLGEATPTARYLIRHAPCPVLTINPKFGL